MLWLRLDQCGGDYIVYEYKIYDKAKRVNVVIVGTGESARKMFRTWGQHCCPDTLSHEIVS